MTHHASSRTSIVLASCITALAACGGDASSDLTRSPAMLTRIERTTERATMRTVELQDIHYSGSQLDLIAYSLDGAANGSVSFSYGEHGITGVEYSDAEGNRETGQIMFDDGLVVHERYEITGVRVDDVALTYDPDQFGQLDEIATTTTFTSGAPNRVTMVRYEYDDAGRRTKMWWLDGPEIESVALEYAPDGKLNRATWMSATTALRTYVYSYTEDGRLKDSIGTNGGRFEVRYDDLGRIAQVRESWPEGTITENYEYAAGEIDGWTFSPNIPMASLFDMTGTSFSDTDLEHGSFGPYDIPG
ncbi:MAG: hypothetical protein AB7P03_01480 [Kofleriaceae bacterium]